MMSGFDSLPGAISEGDGVLHFGSPALEQRALAVGRAVVPLADRALIAVTGPDRLGWLDSITSQALTNLSPGESTELLVLDPQGRIEHAAGAFDDGETVWLIADAADADPLAGWLQRMVFRSRVTVTVRPEFTLVGFFAGGDAEARLCPAAPSGIPVIWRDPWSYAGGHQYAQTDDHPASDFAWSVAALGEGETPEGPYAGLLAAEALRVAAWRPRWAAEVDERSLPHETDWLRSAVHLNKGCYRGQETVAKVHNLGHPPRRLALLHLDGSDAVLPERGDAVWAGNVEVGTLTSVARHYEDGPIALAVLSRRAPVGDLVVRTSDAEIAAAQQVIVPADAGATADIPRLTRLSRRPSAPDPRR